MGRADPLAIGYVPCMSYAIEQPPLVTVAEFDRFLDTQRGETRYELIGGEIVAMTNPTVSYTHLTLPTILLV